jgi:predicted lipoprotein
LGINTPKQTPVLTLTPNPADNYVTVSVGTVGNATMKVVDVLGNVVMTDVITDGTETINLSDFKNGVYFIQVESSESKLMTRKLIVRH